MIRDPGTNKGLELVVVVCEWNPGKEAAVPAKDAFRARRPSTSAMWRVEFLRCSRVHIFPSNVCQLTAESHEGNWHFI